MFDGRHKVIEEIAVRIIEPLLQQLPSGDGDFPAPSFVEPEDDDVTGPLEVEEGGQVRECNELREIPACIVVSFLNRFKLIFVPGETCPLRVVLVMHYMVYMWYRWR